MPNTLRYLLFPVLHALGPVLMGYGLIMLIPWIVSVTQQDGADGAFLEAAMLTFAAGAALTLLTRRFKLELTARHGFLLVTLVWTVVPLFAVVPIMIELPQYSLVQIYFETMSCLTTTGATVMTGLDDLPLSINGWRCFLAWMGGMGLIVLSVAILPLLGVGGAQILKAETSGPLKETRLTPRIADTAQALYLIYFGISVILAVLYHFAGMSCDDAVMHMMTTVSLSGISAHDASFGYFANPAIETISIIFMVICGFNFSLHFAAWHHRSIGTYLRDPEAKAWVGALAVLTLISAATLVVNGVYDPLTALRHAAFSVVSAASTSGFGTEDWSAWPSALPILIMLSAGCFSCAGSTGGGVKMIRLIIAAKVAKREYLRLLYPNAVLPLTIGKTTIDDKIAFSVIVFLVVWVFSTFALTIAQLIAGMPVETAISATIACITNLGPGLGPIGPSGNYAALTEPQLAICTFAMLIGRLEIFTVFTLFTRAFWRV